jgi:hypothetical protein
MHEPSKQELKTLEAELAQVMLQNDVPALDRLLSDEVIFTDPQEGLTELPKSKSPASVAARILWRNYPRDTRGLSPL